MRTALTFIGLGWTVLAISCGSPKRGHRAGVVPPVSSESPSPSSSTPPSPSPASGPVEACVEVAGPDASNEKWLAQLPGAVRFSIGKKNGSLFARPTCVKDSAHVPDWLDVVERVGIFGELQLTVTYANSVESLFSTERFVKDERLILTSAGSSWSGVRREVTRRPWIVDDLFGPVDADISLPTCTTTEMNTPVVLPRTLRCPRS